MCLACTALQLSRPASRKRRLCKPPLGRLYIMSGCKCQTNPDKYIRHLINVVDMDDSNTESDKGARTLSQANACSMVVICYVP